MDIREDIANNRLKRIKTEGYGLSCVIPKEREFPINNFYINPFVICEVKRGSPSKGKFAGYLNAVEQAKIYEGNGVKQVSVLTEEDRFFGSLTDLMDIKRACPNLSVLRKDFLLDLKDVETSYLCGADAFLLITSLLPKKLLEEMYNYGVELGLTPLVEVHDMEDVIKLRDLKPKLVGINSRNLKTFTIDPLRPLKIKSYINWDCDIIYESGIKTEFDVNFARDTGFSGVLVGEWAVKNSEFSGVLIKSFSKPPKISPWNRLFNRYNDEKPFTKICGITNRSDALYANDLGADLLGFILAPSPRKVDVEFIKNLSDINILKVGVVVLKRDEDLPKEIIDLIENGYLDFIQFHGDESFEQCVKQNVPFYKAIRVKSPEDIKTLENYPLVSLVDSFSEDSYGGTGKMIDRDLTLKVRKSANLWLAGGLNPENIKSIIKEFKPELIDVSSGLEISPGIKDKEKMKKYFEELK